MTSQWTRVKPCNCCHDFPLLLWHEWRSIRIMRFSPDGCSQLGLSFLSFNWREGRVFFLCGTRSFSLFFWSFSSMILVMGALVDFGLVFDNWYLLRLLVVDNHAIWHTYSFSFSHGLWILGLALDKSSTNIHSFIFLLHARQIQTGKLINRPSTRNWALPWRTVGIDSGTLAIRSRIRVRFPHEGLPRCQSMRNPWYILR